MSNVQRIPLEAIDPPAFNSRLDVDNAEIDKLALSMKLRGQDTPITVAAKGDDRYELIAGSRRVAAARKLEWTHVHADVKGNGDAAANALTNAVENLQRKDLSTYETARVVAHLRSLGLKGKDIKEQTGLSESHISNLAVCFEKLPDNIKEEWRKQHPAADVGFMRNLITYKDGGKTVERTPEAIQDGWAQRLAMLAPAEEPEDEDEDEPETTTTKKKAANPEPPYRVQVGRVERLLKALKNGKAPQIAIEAVRYTIGKVEKIKGYNLEDKSAKPADKK